MMKFSHYRDVHPNWEEIRQLDRDESETVLDLLMTGVLIDGELTEDELDTLREEWMTMPFVPDDHDGQKLAEMLDETRRRHREFFDNPDAGEAYLEGIASKIEGEEKQLAVLRLLAITTVVDGWEERELDLCFGLGGKFGFESDTVDTLMRSVYETYMKNRRKARGEDPEMPYTAARKLGGHQSLSVGQNPFTQPTHIDSPDDYPHTVERPTERGNV